MFSGFVGRAVAIANEIVDVFGLDVFQRVFNELVREPKRLELIDNGEASVVCFFDFGQRMLTEFDVSVYVEEQVLDASYVVRLFEFLFSVEHLSYIFIVI